MRVQVTLATGIPAEVCEAINLGYRDPATINPADYADREDEGILSCRRPARCSITCAAAGWAREM